jgi:hypothetical protein
MCCLFATAVKELAPPVVVDLSWLSVNTLSEHLAVAVVVLLCPRLYCSSVVRSSITQLCCFTIGQPAYAAAFYNLIS